MPTLRHAHLLLAASLVFVGCGPDETPEDTSATPVASTPLAGTFKGQPWTAAQGRARAWSFGEGNERWIDVGSSPLGCNGAGDAQLIGTIDWAPGTSYALSLTRNLTFSYDDNGTSENLVAITGRVELVSAPDQGLATVRIRARYDADFSVEGEVQLEVCP